VSRRSSKLAFSASNKILNLFPHKYFNINRGLDNGIRSASFQRSAIEKAYSAARHLAIKEARESLFISLLLYHEPAAFY
jgi:hypothetical protein